jgi:hypothetical protein
MKRFLFLTLIGFYGCIISTADQWEDYPHAVAITIPKTELRYSVYAKAPRELRDPGKIYVFGNLLFIVERYTGVHVIDNSTPTSPKNLGFINVPGCSDIAVKGNTLYVDNAIDLIAIDVSDPSSVKVTSRHENVFPPLPPPEDAYNIKGYPPSDNEVIIGWKYE